MKNLPEKIYLNLNMTPQEVVETKDKDFHEATKTWEITWSEERLNEHDPEYVRKDAFIEKAVSYLNSKLYDLMQNSKLYDWVRTTNPNQRSYANTIMKQDFIRDFKNYMEGE